MAALRSRRTGPPETALWPCLPTYRRRPGAEALGPNRLPGLEPKVPAMRCPH
jgi:hypothetical protein